MDTNQPAGAGVEGVTAPEAQTVATTEATEQPAEAQPEEKKADVDYAAEYKKLQNALARRERNIGKLTAQKYQTLSENEQLKARLAQYEASKSSPTASDAPQEANFTNYGDYLKAVARYEARQELKQGQQEHEKKQTEVSQRQWREERESALADNAAKAREAFPDFQNTLQENSDIFASLPPHVEQAFLDSDNPAFAFYSMVKDGSLEQLLNAPSEARAAAMIARAEERALAQSKTKQATKAPAPMSSAKGTAPASKKLDDLSGQELLKWIRSK